MKKYKRLDLEEREQIFALVNQGRSNREIAEVLNLSHTTNDLDPVVRLSMRYDRKTEMAEHKILRKKRV